MPDCGIRLRKDRVYRRSLTILPSNTKASVGGKVCTGAQAIRHWHQEGYHYRERYRLSNKRLRTLARCCRIAWSSGPPIGHPRTLWRLSCGTRSPCRVAWNPVQCHAKWFQSGIAAVLHHWQQSIGFLCMMSNLASETMAPVRTALPCASRDRHSRRVSVIRSSSYSTSCTCTASRRVLCLKDANCNCLQLSRIIWASRSLPSLVIWRFQLIVLARGLRVGWRHLHRPMPDLGPVSANSEARNLFSPKASVVMRDTKKTTTISCMSI